MGVYRWLASGASGDLCISRKYAPSLLHVVWHSRAVGALCIERHAGRRASILSPTWCGRVEYYSLCGGRSWSEGRLVHVW